MSNTSIPAAGWVIEIEGHQVGAPKQTLEIIEVLGSPGHMHYKVRWEDGHESFLYPSSDVHVRPADGG